MNIKIYEYIKVTEYKIVSEYKKYLGIQKKSKHTVKSL